MTEVLLDQIWEMRELLMPLVWIGGGAAAASILLLLVNQARLARRGAGLTLGLAGFFLALQGLGALLGSAPPVYFGDPHQYDLIKVSPWQIGLALLVPGVAVRALARRWQRAATSSPNSEPREI